MSRKSIFAIVGLVLGTVLLQLLKETYLAVAVEAATERAAQSLHIPKPEMMAGAAPYTAALLVIAVAFSIAYRIGERDRKSRPSLEILYELDNPKHVETKDGFYKESPSSTRYYVEIFNRTWDKTIADVEITWDQTPFTEFIDTEIRRSSLQNPISIHPQEKLRVYLFGIDDVIQAAPTDSDVVGHASTFIVRARGKDAPEITAEFEYSPLKFPKLTRLR